MNKNLTGLTNVALSENESIGPAMSGSIEFESDGQYIFQGALVPTTERIYINMEKNDGTLTYHHLNYNEISLVTVERRAILGKVVHFWNDRKIEVSMNVTSEKNLSKFLEFYRKHRARALKFEKMRYEKTHQI